ncbi:MAG: hemerythrin domain-containing protein [Gammaproteobacteria bacterium]|nr:hemerythrin domain-containing protein [Gammaproteobacteria bacterium]
MDVFKLLKQDHKEVKGLFKKLQKTSAQKAREKGLQQLALELTVHTAVEEEIFYPRLREEKKLRGTVNESYEEHHVAKRLLEELVQTPIEDERWQAKLSVLKEMIEHHVQEEEDELFPKASRALGKEESKALGLQIEAAKKQHLQDSRKNKAAARLNGDTEDSRARA